MLTYKEILLLGLTPTVFKNKLLNVFKALVIICLGVTVISILFPLFIGISKAISLFYTTILIIFTSLIVFYLFGMLSIAFINELD